jgi:steroid delta-isomerase-like uncharacterized protein
MSEEDNAAAARRIIDEGFNAGRMEVFDEVCTPDVIGHDPAEQADLSGVEAHKERTKGYRTAMPDLVVTIEDIFASGDRVASRWTASGTNDGELMGMPPTHRHVEIAGLTIDRFDAEGRLAESWDQWDNAGFMTQLGIAPESVAEAG